jgi:hypothetical protein
MNDTERDPIELGPMPLGRPMETVDQRFVRAPWRTIFELAKKVEDWPAHLPHYRYVRFRQRASDGGGIVEMSADPSLRTIRLAHVVDVGNGRR